jgi:hypothetical protein
LTQIWARRGTRPRAPRDRRYGWAYLFGAVCPERAIGAGLVLPLVNAEAMNLHLCRRSAGMLPPAPTPSWCSIAQGGTARRR